MGEGRGKGIRIPAEKREVEETDKVEVAPGVTVANLRHFRIVLNGPTQSRIPQAASTVSIEKTETLRVRSFRCYTSGCKCEIVAIRGGVSEGSRLAVYQTLYRVLLSIFFWHVQCFALLFLSFCSFVLFWFWFSCSRWSFVLMH